MIKQATFYKYSVPNIFNVPFSIQSIPALEDMILLNPCTNPLPSQQQTTGWKSVTVTEGHVLLTMHVKRKVVDTASVNCQVQRIISQLQKSGDKNISKKRKTQIKEDVILEMLPHLPFRDEYINIYFHNGNMVIGASMKKADEAIERLIKDFPVQLGIQLYEPDFDIDVIRNLIDYFDIDRSSCEIKSTGSYSYIDNTECETVTVINDDPDNQQLDFLDIHIESPTYSFKWFSLHLLSTGKLKLKADGTVASVKFDLELEETEEYDRDLILRQHFIVLLDCYRRILNLLNSHKR